MPARSIREGPAVPPFQAVSKALGTANHLIERLKYPAVSLFHGFAENPAQFKSKISAATTRY
jgi:hypothetical protein